ncbi:hypothetical protein EDB86DRAFT_2878102 [Lactarius hatsudake]|nr:hypothetical protein EDB86DRAFT_2878102 [Lactarius hatsudake]
MLYPKAILAIVFLDQIAAKANVPDITQSQTSATCSGLSHTKYVRSSTRKLRMLWLSTAGVLHGDQGGMELAAKVNNGYTE